MPTERKSKVVDELEQVIGKSKVIILTEYRGVKAEQMSSLRRKLRKSDSEIRVVKNTLARIAAKKNGRDTLAENLEGPLALVFGYGEEVAPVRVLVASQPELEGLSVRGGMLGNTLYSKEEIMSLATLPGRDAMIARVLGQMNAPIALLVGAIASPIRGVLTVLQGRIKQLEEAT